MTTLLLYTSQAKGTALPAETTPRPDEHGNGSADAPVWRVYAADDPGLAVLLRQAELHDRRAFQQAYLLTDDGRVLTARMRATIEDERRRIEFAPFFDEQPANPVVISWPATYDELGDRAGTSRPALPE